MKQRNQSFIVNTLIILIIFSIMGCSEKELTKDNYKLPSGALQVIAKIEKIENLSNYKKIDFEIVSVLKRGPQAILLTKGQKLSIDVNNNFISKHNKQKELSKIDNELDIIIRGSEAIGQISWKILRFN